jgi:flagellar biosynthesis protein FlhF
MGIQIKKYRASTLQKAIEDIRADLGDDAVILQTETLKDPRLGILGRTLVEVTAALDRQDPIRFKATVAEDPSERVATTSKQPETAWWKSLLSKKSPTPTKTVNPKKPVPAPQVSQPPSTPSLSTDSMNQMYAIKTFVEPLQKEIENLKSKLQPPAKPVGKRRLQDPLEIEVQQLRTELSSYILEKRYENVELPAAYRQLVHFWNSKGMSSKQIFAFLKQIEAVENDSSADESPMQSLAQVLQESIHEGAVFQKQEPRIVVLIGATGVGKTTTVAKMGAYEKIRLKRKICFVTIDDYKIGGADQMQNYARILEIPFVRSRKDMSLEEQISIQNADTVFIDTFGIAPSDEDKIESLRSMLDFKDPTLKARLEVHLVVPVGVAPRDVDYLLRNFRPLQPQYLLFTKWDETENWGGMLSTILEAKKPVSLICHGQNVPDDMSVFSSQKFISTVTSVDGAEVVH